MRLANPRHIPSLHPKLFGYRHGTLDLGRAA
jgi:hypothetical protein